MESLNAVNLIVNSSLPYQINAYMPTEIQNADKTNAMNKDILNIRANGESNYNTFVDTSTPIVLLDNQPADNNVSHGVDLMLKGSIAHKKDIYKTRINSRQCKNKKRALKSSFFIFIIEFSCEIPSPKTFGF